MVVNKSGVELSRALALNPLGHLTSPPSGFLSLWCPNGLGLSMQVASLYWIFWISLPLTAETHKWKQELLGLTSEGHSVMSAACPDQTMSQACRDSGGHFDFIPPACRGRRKCWWSSLDTLYWFPPPHIFFFPSSQRLQYVYLNLRRICDINWLLLMTLASANP